MIISALVAVETAYAQRREVPWPQYKLVDKTIHDIT